MNIPDKAMDAAFQAATGGAELHLDDRMYWEQTAKDMLEAAAPFIAAQALHDEAVRLRRVDGHDWYVHDRHTRDALTARANKVNP